MLIEKPKYVVSTTMDYFDTVEDCLKRNGFAWQKTRYKNRNIDIYPLREGEFIITVGDKKVFDGQCLNGKKMEKILTEIL